MVRHGREGVYGERVVQSIPAHLRKRYLNRLMRGGDQYRLSDEARSLIVFKQLNLKVTTPRLNQLLKTWIGEYALPVRGRNVKIRYATQTGVNPVRFLFFVNNLKGYPKRYNQYLTGRIRRDLGYDKIPLFIDVRES